MIAKNKRLYLVGFIFALIHWQSFLDAKHSLVSYFIFTGGTRGTVVTSIVTCFILFDLLVLPLLMDKKRFLVKAGIILSLVHLSLFASAADFMLKPIFGPQWQMSFTLFFTIDFFLMPLFMVFPWLFVFIFGGIGTLCWFLIPIAIAKIRPLRETTPIDLAKDATRRKIWDISLTIILVIIATWLAFSLLGGKQRAVAPVLTINVKEAEHLLQEIQGYIICDLPIGGIKVISLPDLRERTIRQPDKSTPEKHEARCPSIHVLSGPDNVGRIAFVENDMCRKEHFLKIRYIHGDEREDVIFSRKGDALWDNFVGDDLALAPFGGYVAFISKAQSSDKWQAPHLLEIWDINKKSQILQKDLNASESGGLCWFPDGKRIVYTKFIPRDELARMGVVSEGFAESGTDERPVVCVIYEYDVSNDTSRFLAVGSNPIISPDGASIFVSDYHRRAYNRIVDTATGSFKPVDLPGNYGGAIAFVDNRMVLYIGLPTTGTPLRGGTTTITLKVFDLDTRVLQTVKVKDEDEISFSYGQKR